MKRLLLLRHAKAEAESSGGDHARVLAPRGERDAAAMGAAMKRAGYLPDLALCSTAARTRQTFALAAPLLGAPGVIYDDILYLAPWKTIVKRVRDVEDASGVLMVVGHNTGLEECAAALLRAKADGHERGLRAAMAAKFPTGALAVIDCPIRHWRELAPATSALSAFVTPKALG